LTPASRAEDTATTPPGGSRDRPRVMEDDGAGYDLSVAVETAVCCRLARRHPVRHSCAGCGLTA